jgi:hypothetical protein
MSTDSTRRAPLSTLASITGGRPYPDDVRTDDPADSIQIFGNPERRTAGPRKTRVPLSRLGERDVRATEGDLVLGLSIPVEAPVMIERGEWLIDTRHCLLRPVKGSPITVEWLYVWASSSEFGEQVTTRARILRSRVSIQELRSFSVPLPSREAQLRAFEELRDLGAATLLARRQLQILTELGPAMADRAVAVSMTDEAVR